MLTQEIFFTVALPFYGYSISNAIFKVTQDERDELHSEEWR